MAINFPDSPTTNEVFSAGGRTWKWDGTTWLSVGAELVVADITDLTASATEINYTDGVTSAIQTQLNARAALSGASFTGNISTTGTIQGMPSLPTNSTSADNVGYVGMPQVLNPTSPYTISAGDGGEHIYMTSTGRTITIPANASVPLEIGTTVVIINANGVTTTISINSDTLRQANTTNTGTRTLAANGMATLVKVAATEWVISGNGLS
jgi:hypothetical protein